MKPYGKSRVLSISSQTVDLDRRRQVKCRQLELAGAWLIEPDVFDDERGCFVKTMHVSVFRQCGIEFVPREEFLSISHAGVLRGMHFQVPPADHAKLVYCVGGEVVDVILDIRRSSLTYGKCCSINLGEANRSVLYVPRGFAHGFLSLKEGSTVVYKTTHAYVPECDVGIRWDSFGFQWPIENPTISKRDQMHPPLEAFSSPF